MAHATIRLPLHGGHAPPYLIDRMSKLSGAIAKVIVNEYGAHELHDGVRLSPSERLSNGIYVIIVNQGTHTVKQKLLIKD